MSYIRTNYRYPLVSLGAPPKHTTALATARRNLRISLRGLGVAKKSVSSAVARRNVRMHLRGLNYVTLGSPRHTTALATARRNTRMRTGGMGADPWGITGPDPINVPSPFAPTIPLDIASWLQDLPGVGPPSPVQYTGPSIPGLTTGATTYFSPLQVPGRAPASASLIPGVSNWVLGGGAALLLTLALVGSKRR